MAQLTKEGGSVVNNAVRHLSFLDSELVAKAVRTSTFDPKSLLKPGTTLFLQITPDQLEAQRGLLRYWVSSLVRVVGAVGDERDSEVLFLLDEAQALGSLPALEEMLVRGRSSGARSILAYQSDSSIKAAIKGKPTLIYDNCSTQIFLGAPTGLETAERLSKTLGDYTQILETYNENESTSGQSGGDGRGGSTTRSRGSSLNYAGGGRALKRSEELMTQSRDLVIVLQAGMDPILANRVKWYEDAEFAPTAKRVKGSLWRKLVASMREERGAWLVLLLIVAGIVGLILWDMANQARQMNVWINP